MRRAAVLALALGLTACQPRIGQRLHPRAQRQGSSAPRAVEAVSSTARSGTAVRFVDVTDQAGIRFVHENAARGKRYLPETLGSGVAVFDADGDGWQDLFFVNFLPWPGDERPGPLPTSAAYRNRGDGTFEDVTSEAGLALSAHCMGATAGDHDGDGDDDLFVTCLGPDHLFRNDGGTFVDVTAEVGIVDDDFGSSATWIDHDADGDLDLFVANYVQWSIETDIHCTLDGKQKSYCTPESYQGASPRLWRNEGGGRFVDGTEQAGLHDPTLKALGVVALDYDQDGRIDLAVANDTQPNSLFRNLGDGTFVDEGLASGIAFDEAGFARGAMGIDAADADGSGRPSLVIGNFANEMLALYENQGSGLFVDVAPRTSVGHLSLLTLAFGCFFFDFDQDGVLDIFVLNGHLEPEIHAVQPTVTYRQPPHLFRGVAGGYEEVTSAVGADLAAPKVGRGAAYGDFDGDGDLDLVVTSNGDRARLYRNDGGNANHWVSVLPRGTASNTDGYGAVVRVTAGGRTRTAYAKAASSYLSQSERALSFGLGDVAAIERLEIAWPSGKVDTWSDVGVDRHWVAVEGGELQPLVRRRD